MSDPKPDEFGRFRVLQDTGTKFSVSRAPLAGERVLNEPASDVAGDALPPEYPESAPVAVPPVPVEQNPQRPAGPDLKKENAHG